MREESLGNLAEWMRVAQSSRAASAGAGEDPLQAAFTGATAGLALLLLDGRFHLANPAVCRMLGRSAAELRDVSVVSLLHPFHRMSAFTFAEAILDASTDEYRHERAFVRPDGSIVWIDVTAIVLRDAAGAPQFILAVGNDVTERRRRSGLSDPTCDADRAPDPAAAAAESTGEREARLTQAAGELDSMCRAMAHDVRAPIRIMAGYADILSSDLEGTLSADNRRFLEAIAEQSRRLGRMLDGLLELSRLTRSTVRRSAIDMEARARAVFEPLRKQTNGAVELVVGPLQPAGGDPVLVDTLLFHLLSNAVKFTRAAERPRIEVGCNYGNERTSYYVRDNGVGFDMAHAGKLFDTFERLHRAEGFEGEGVGLAAVRRIVERHGGSVWAEASPGAGATFYFTLET